MTVNKLLVVCAVSLFGLAACGGSQSTLPSGQGAGAADGGFGGGGFDGGASTTGDGGGSGIGVFATEAERELLNNLVVYFEFDRSEIRSEFNDMLAAHGRYLANNPNASVRLEGHADERGSREYNIGLGERRAQAVRQILLLQGASASQLSTVSYGEERPAVFGSDEESYSLNRRVEIVYR
jgi:peptidoglycan-associated lipoprotein